MNKNIIRVICDESGHLEKDNIPVMVIGALYIKNAEVHRISTSIKLLKQKHGIHPNQELKWNNISPSKVNLYLDVVDLFLKESNLSFRAIAAHKDGIDHEKHDQTHSDWFFKIYYRTLEKMLDPSNLYEIFIDRVDTASSYRAKDLKEMLNRHFANEIVKSIQVTDSKRSPLMQITDLLVGAISYKHRELSTNSAKLEIIKKIETSLRIDLKNNSKLSDKKFNVFNWDLGKK